MYQITLMALGNYYFDKIDWIQVATVVVAGIAIVLGVLIVLIGVFSGFGKLVSNMEAAAKKKNAKKNDGDAVTVKSEMPKAAPIQAQAQPKPVIEDGISGEVVAAITAAVVASEGTGNVVIRSVKRKDVGSRNPWARAAVIENTRSF